LQSLKVGEDEAISFALVCPTARVVGALVRLDRLDNRAGWDNAALPEPTPSHASCLKTRTLRSSSPTTMAPAHFAGDRVHVCWAVFDFTTL